MASGLANGLPGLRHQHEHSLAAIQDEPFTLALGAKIHRGFFGCFVADKPTATTAADVSWIDETLAMKAARPPSPPAVADTAPRARTLFATAVLLESLPLDEAEIRALFGDAPRHEERENGELLSFFTGAANHVVLHAKELKVLRPHGHLLRTGRALTPDESALTSTCWMAGVFHSMVTQGHVSINRFLSTCHSYLGLFRSHGQRIFMATGDGYVLLDQPSAFEMAPSHCRWIYQHTDGLIEVTASAPDGRHELRLDIEVTRGPAAAFLIVHHVAINGDDGSLAIPLRREARGTGVRVMAVPDSDVGRRFPDGGFTIMPADGTTLTTIGGDELLFTDGVSRHQPYLCLVTAPARAAGLVITGDLVADGGVCPDPELSAVTITAPAAGPLSPAAARLAEIVPWFVHNALVHYLSPRGLEQYSGGGWGTRDVCQGPVELLLAHGRFAPVRDLLCRVFRQQNDDGDWPQWFMFFERERNIRPGDSHGDIVYWPLLALAQYLTASGDAGLLDEMLPYFHPAGDGAATAASMAEHVGRALDLIRRRVIAGTSLAAYGHGDWNDSLQPAKPDMRERLCSSWTVTLNYQTLRALAAAFHQIGMPDGESPDSPANLERLADTVLDEFQQKLIVDEVVTGLAYFHETGRTDQLLHPADTVTGLSYSLLPMIHAVINDMFTPPQAAAHLATIRQHLLGPDGAHLFDRPLAYHGGPQTYFQRAESASFFGREIGIMYTHAHLRYCEALARFGDAEGFFTALCQANPIALRVLVPAATPRQANCYYSSSDPAFHDRYEAFEQYAGVMRGEVPLEGGWRVYSSGAGIGVRLIMQCFLGLRLERAALVVDPVIPPALSGLTANLQIADYRFEVVYQTGGRGCGPVSINLNGTDIEFTRDANPYRPGAARIPLDAIAGLLTGTANRLAVVVG